MNTLTIAVAINKLSQLNVKLLTGLPLCKEDEYLSELANQIADELVIVEEQEVQPPSPTQEIPIIPPGFKETGKNANYRTFSDQRFKIRRYNNTKFPGHLSRILTEVEGFGRYDVLKIRLDEEVGPFPTNATIEEVIEWVTKIATHLGITIVFWSTGQETPHIIKGLDDKIRCPVYYHENQFYHLISVKY